MKTKIFLLLTTLLIVNLGANEICKLSQTPFGKLIRHMESQENYNAYNVPTGKKKDLGNFTEMSIAEVIDLQLVQNRLHAVGAYQMARPINSNTGVRESVVQGCATALGIVTTGKFDKVFQDRCFDEYLTTSKKWRGAIHDYFYGNGSLDKAALATAQEWASAPVKIGQKRSNGSLATNSQQSYYVNDKDAALTTYENLIATMELTKEQIQSNQCNPDKQPDNNTTRPDNNSTDGNFGDYDDDIGDDVNVGVNVGGGCGGCLSVEAIRQSTENSLLNFKSMEQQTARAINSIIEAIFYAHQDLEKQNENLAKQTQKLMEEENLIQKELLYNKIRINKLQDLINTKKAEE